MPRFIVSFDPGDTSGWSTWDYDEGEPLEEGSVFHTEMPEWLTDRNLTRKWIKAIVIEDFRLMQNKAIAQTGSHFYACQIIGMLKLWAYSPEQSIPIKLQPPSIKGIAERLTGRKPVGAHKKSHSVDAYNHAAFYLRQEGKYRSLLERQGL
jgi:hypothetical protein